MIVKVGHKIVKDDQLSKMVDHKTVKGVHVMQMMKVDHIFVKEVNQTIVTVVDRILVTEVDHRIGTEYPSEDHNSALVPHMIVRGVQCNLVKVVVVGD